MSVAEGAYEYTLVIVFETGAMPAYYRIPDCEIGDGERKILSDAHARGYIRQTSTEYPADYAIWRLSVLDENDMDEYEEIALLVGKQPHVARGTPTGRWADYYRAHPIDTNTRFRHVYCFREPQEQHGGT